jgi:hypothetical protein
VRGKISEGKKRVADITCGTIEVVGNVICWMIMSLGYVKGQSRKRGMRCSVFSSVLIYQLSSAHYFQFFILQFKMQFCKDTWLFFT